MEPASNLSWLGISLIVAGAFAITWFLVGLLVRHAARFGLVDRPNERSSHVRATPRGAGAAIVCVWLLGVALSAPKFFAGELVFISVVAVAASAVAVVSLWDDFCSLSASVRLAVHSVAAVMVVWAAAASSAEPMPMLMVVPAVLWIVGLTNVFNFMDGIDGLAGVQAMVTGAACLIAGILLGHGGIVVSSALMIGGAAGFLRHNWSPARIFMGDVGSAFCGFVFAVTILWMILVHTPYHERNLARPLLAGLLAVGPFFGDGVLTLLARLVRGQAIWKPHRSHFYQRLVLAGWSHAATARYYGMWAVATAGAALGISCGASLFLAGIGVAFLLVTWALVRGAERRQHRVVPERC